MPSNWLAIERPVVAAAPSKLTCVAIITFAKEYKLVCSPDGIPMLRICLSSVAYIFIFFSLNSKLLCDLVSAKYERTHPTALAIIVANATPATL